MICSGLNLIYPFLESHKLLEIGKMEQAIGSFGLKHFIMYLLISLLGAFIFIKITRKRKKEYHHL